LGTILGTDWGGGKNNEAVVALYAGKGHGPSGGGGVWKRRDKRGGAWGKKKGVWGTYEGGSGNWKRGLGKPTGQGPEAVTQTKGGVAVGRQGFYGKRRGENNVKMRSLVKGGGNNNGGEKLRGEKGKRISWG